MTNTYTVNILPPAQRDIDKITDYYLEEVNSAYAASYFIGKLADVKKVLELFPNAGAKVTGRMEPRQKKNRNLRYFPVDSYNVFYFIENKQVNIIRVLHSKQDFYHTL